MEAMAARLAAGADAQRLHLGHGAAEQRHQPVQRAGETVGVVAPAHRLGDRHRRQRLVQHGGQQVDGQRARRHRAVDETLALRIGGLFQLRPVDPGLGGEALQRLGRLAVGVQRDVEVGAEHFGLLFRLFDRHAWQQHGESARRVQRLGIAAVDGDATLVQRGDHAVEEGLRQARQRLDRQLFGAEFDQQRLHAHAAASVLAARCFRPGKPSASRCA